MQGMQFNPQQTGGNICLEGQVEHKEESYVLDFSFLMMSLSFKHVQAKIPISLLQDQVCFLAISIEYCA